MAHLCGLCLTLRDQHGQLSRLVTNVDGLLLSVLVEAQAPSAGQHRVAGPCPLRHMRPAIVTASTEPGIRYAAAVSLVAAASRINDHLTDGDGPLRRKPVAVVARWIADRFAGTGSRSAAALGFDTRVLTDAVTRTQEQEHIARPGVSVLAVTEPTEHATAAAFEHTAVLAGRQHNRDALRDAGGMFGRLVHVLDAVTDLEVDRRRGAWNLLDATATDLQGRGNCATTRSPSSTPRSPGWTFGTGDWCGCCSSTSSTGS